MGGIKWRSRQHGKFNTQSAHFISSWGEHNRWGEEKLFSNSRNERALKMRIYFIIQSVDVVFGEKKIAKLDSKRGRRTFFELFSSHILKLLIAKFERQEISLKIGFMMFWCSLLSFWVWSIRIVFILMILVVILAHIPMWFEVFSKIIIYEFHLISLCSPSFIDIEALLACFHSFRVYIFCITE